MKEKIAVRGISILLVLFALIMLLIERGPPVVAILLLVFAGVGANWRAVFAVLKSSPPVWLLAALSIWILLSSTWSIAGVEGLERGMRIVGMIAIATLIVVTFYTLSKAEGKTLSRWPLLSASFMVLLLLVETMLDMPLLRLARYYANGELYGATLPAIADREPGIHYSYTSLLVNRLTHLSSVVAILALPTAASLWMKEAKLLAVGTFCAAVIALAFSPAQAPLLALALGGIAALVVALVVRQRLATAVATALAVGVILMPWGAKVVYDNMLDEAAALDASAIHRLAIWDNAASLVAEQPLLGFGIEASRVIGRAGENIGDVVPGHAVTTFQALPLHPHNAAIQIWLELGGVGALGFAVFLFVTTLTVWKLNSDHVARAALMGSWATALTIVHLSYGIWQFWWIATLGILAAMVCMMLPEGQGK